MRTLSALKPQDILILLKIFVWRNRPNWRNLDIANELGLSQFEVSVGLERCRQSKLIDATKKQLMRSALLEFLIHGIKYVYPAQLGSVCRGMPTAHSAPPLVTQMIVDDEERYVWPDEEGTSRGQALTPIYDTVPLAAKKDSEMYQLLALIDAIRIGRARDQSLAIEEFKKRFTGI